MKPLTMQLAPVDISSHAASRTSAMRCSCTAPSLLHRMRRRDRVSDRYEGRERERQGGIREGGRLGWQSVLAPALRACAQSSARSYLPGRPDRPAPTHARRRALLSFPDPHVISDPGIRNETLNVRTPCARS